MPRTLSEGEFTAIKSALLDQAPDGLSEQEFQRWFQPRFDGAIAEAENSKAPVSGSALRRFVSGAAGMLNPVTMVKGLATAVAHPVETAGNLYEASADQARKAKSAYDEGRYFEMVGHGLGATPIIGPTVAGVGERIAETGDIATGLGETAGLIAPVMATSALRSRVRARARAGEPARIEQAAAQQVAEQVLAPANPRFKGKAQSIAPEVLRRGMKGGREELAQMAEEGQHAAGQAIDDAITAGGGRQAGVVIDPIVSQLQNSIDDLSVGGRPIPGAEGRVAQLQERIDYLTGVSRQRPQQPGLSRAGQAPPINPKAMSFDELMRIRDEQYAQANQARAYERMGNPALSDQGFAARETGSAIRQEVGRLSPDLASANADYAFYKTLGDVLDPTQGRPKSGKLPSGVTGGERVSGALAGEIVGGKIGGFVLGQVIPWIKELKNSPAWQLADAQDKMRLAAAIRAGNVPKAQGLMARIAQGGVAAQSATSPSESRRPRP